MTETMTIPSIHRRLRTAGPELSRSRLDRGGGGGDGEDGGMEGRIDALEAANFETRDRLARIETRLDSFATHEDLHKAINAQTWRLVSFVCSFGTALVAATYFVARHLN